MKNHIVDIETVIDYIETHLDGKLDLKKISEAAHYSKYYLHRIFTSTVGMTIHDYAIRRQLTEAAKLLVFSDKPIIEVAFITVFLLKFLRIISHSPFLQNSLLILLYTNQPFFPN